MLNINRALENERLLRALTGLNRQAFNELCQDFAHIYQESLDNDPTPRQRARGGGRKGGLSSNGTEGYAKAETLME